MRCIGFPDPDAGCVDPVAAPSSRRAPHAAQYSVRARGPNFRMSKVTDPQTNELVAYTIAIPRFNQQGRTRVIPRHGRICNESDVVECRDMVTRARRIQLLAAKGLTLEQVMVARPTLDDDGVYASGDDRSRDAFVEAIYHDVRQAPVKEPQAGRVSRSVRTFVEALIVFADNDPD